MKAFFQSFLSFRFSILVGIAVAAWLYLMQSELQPLSSFLLEKQIYLIALLIILGFRISIWILIEKAALYNLKHMLGNIIIDCLTCVATLLSVSGCLFLLSTFILQ